MELIKRIKTQRINTLKESVGQVFTQINEGGWQDQFGFEITTKQNNSKFYLMKDGRVIASFYSFDTARLVSTIIVNDIILNSPKCRLTQYGAQQSPQTTSVVSTYQKTKRA